MASRYWVGEQGNWGDISHWSESSGGEGGSSVPINGDTAIFDDLSSNIYYEIYIDTTVSIPIITLTNLYPPSFVINGGSMSLQENLDIYNLNILDGSLTTNNYNILASDIIIQPNAIVDFGYSKITIRADDFFGYTPKAHLFVYEEATINASNATIEFHNSTSNYNGGRLSSGGNIIGTLNIICSSGIMSLIKSNIFNSLSIVGDGIILFNDNNDNTYSTTQQTIISNLILEGDTPGGLVLNSLRSFNGDDYFWETNTEYWDGDFVAYNGKYYNCLLYHTSGTFEDDLISGYWILEEIDHWIINKDSDIIYTNNCTIKNSTATGDAVFYALLTNGNIDGSNNTGWIFEGTPPPSGSIILQSLPNIQIVKVGSYQQYLLSIVSSGGIIEDYITSDVTWASSNENIATVSSSGLVYAVSLGNVTISATYGGVTLSIGIKTTKDTNTRQMEPERLSPHPYTYTATLGVSSRTGVK